METRGFITPSSDFEAGWLTNPPWERAPEQASGIVHGTLCRRADDLQDRASFAKSIARLNSHLVSLGGENLSFRLVGGEQIHEDRIEIVTGNEIGEAALHVESGGPVIHEGYEFEATDALVTSQPGILLVIKTADCLPILFWDPEAKIVAACHCGWRGLFADLALKTAEAAFALGASSSSLQAWIGPGIEAANYEVSEEMMEEFAAKFPDADFSPAPRKLDLVAIAASQLHAAGLATESIFDCGACTYSDPDRYHSYRRDGDAAGRLLTVIGMF